MISNKTFYLLASSCAALVTAPAVGQDVSPARAPVARVAPQQVAAAPGEIIVTARRRSESINSIGATITAATGADLINRGVLSTVDLNKVVAGLSVTPSGTGLTGQPIYTLRGIGFNEKSLGALPAISFSDDEMPLPYNYMTAGPTLDLQRVEVLKGPQGTLYGQNSTAGAINFISNQPTDKFTAGGDLTYGSYNAVVANGYVSGPLSDTIKARLALTSTTADGWQRSISRPGDHLGSKDAQAGRLIIDWTPTSELRFALTLNGWQDHSESQAAQLIGLNPAAPLPIAGPFAFLSAQFPSPVVLPSNSKLADWDPGNDYRNHNRFGQAGLRMDWTFAPDITLTSITSGNYLRYDSFSSVSGTPTAAFNYFAGGTIKTFSEEARVAGQLFSNRLHWIVGGNIAHDTIHDHGGIAVPTTATLFVATGIGSPYLFGNEVRKTQAGFASVDYDLTPTVSLTAGVRYTAVQLGFNGCAQDSGDGSDGAFFTGGLAGAGQCFTYLNETGPSAGQAVPPTSADFGVVHKQLNEHNVSWKGGVNWKPVAGTLVYANISRGFKGGNFPTLSATTENQYDPVVQEKVTAYEVGLKTRPFGSLLQLNGALFYSSYRNKQLYGYIFNGFFGIGESTVNIPRSRTYGAEVEATLRPVSGLTLQGNGTYTSTKILKAPACPDPSNPGPTCLYSALTYTTYPGGPANLPLDVTGQRFNLAPKWQANFDAEYKWGITSAIDAFLGGSVVYQSSETPTIGASTGQIVNGIKTTDQTISAYTTLDLRAGLETKDGQWRLSVWGRNVTNAYYTTAVVRGFDQTVRYTGMPVTVGATIGLKFR